MDGQFVTLVVTHPLGHRPPTRRGFSRSPISPGLLGGIVVINVLRHLKIKGELKGGKGVLGWFLVFFFCQILYWGFIILCFIYGGGKIYPPPETVFTLTPPETSENSGHPTDPCIQGLAQMRARTSTLHEVSIPCFEMNNKRHYFDQNRVLGFKTQASTACLDISDGHGPRVWPSRKWAPGINGHWSWGQPKRLYGARAFLGVVHPVCCNAGDGWSLGHSFLKTSGVSFDLGTQRMSAFLLLSLFFVSFDVCFCMWVLMQSSSMRNFWHPKVTGFPYFLRQWGERDGGGGGIK